MNSRKSYARWWTAIVSLGLLPLAAMADAASTAESIVTIAQGSLRGSAEGSLQVFRGVPYAAPPVGEHRWRPPLPAAAWRGVRDATRFGAVCPQILRAGYSLESLSGRAMSEDCLHANVWTPRAQGEARLPVMVWILPGSFLMGDGGMELYDGSTLAGDGVVVVTFNYRLGLFGLFAHPALSRVEADEPLGNYHLMDQIAALRWVRENIAAFGGDPANVTIFGMSAGGVSVNYHLASAASAGLFDKAISQSSGIRVMRDRQLRGDLPGLPSLETEGLQIAKKLGIDADDPAAAQKLRGLSMQQLLEFQRNNMIGVGGSLNPVIDGRIVERSVGEVFRAGEQHKVPYLTGATSWEGSLLEWAKSADPVLGILGISRAQADALYAERDDRQLNNKLYADFFFGSQRYLAKQHALAGQPTYVYHFTRVLDAHQGDHYGAAHGAETRYVFGTLDGLGSLAGPAQPGVFGYRVGDADRAYAELVRGYWVQFARSGNPNGDGRPGWPASSPGNDLLLEFGQQSPEVRRDFRRERQQFWERHFEDGKL
jgi:para-nitrobenzyl esterase